MGGVPVVDASCLFVNGGASGADATAAVDSAIGAALASAGACVLTGIPEEVTVGPAKAERLFSVFDLPLDALDEVSGRGLWGYSAGLSWAKSWNAGPPLPSPRPGTWDLDAHVFTPTALADADAHFQPNVWPEERALPGWRAAMEAHHAALDRLGTTCVRSLARWLEVDEEEAARPWRENLSTLRPLKYTAPPADHDDSSEPLLVFPEHRDNGTGLSILWSSAPGLEMQSPAGEWLAVPVVANSVSLHVGKGLELLSGGRLRATPHRVVATAHNRLSLGFFFCPHPGNEVKPLAGRSEEAAVELEESMVAASARWAVATGGASEAMVSEPGRSESESWPWWSSNSVRGYRAQLKAAL